MAASDPQGEMQFWFNGQPIPGVRSTGTPLDGGEMQYWFNGQPYTTIFPAGGAPPAGPVIPVFMFQYRQRRA